MLRIKSKRNLFRRCGMAHPTGPVEYPDDRFNAKELAILKGEPMLTVVAVKGEKTPYDMTVAELKALLDKMKVPYDDKAKKAELVDLAQKAILDKKE